MLTWNGHEVDGSFFAFGRTETFAHDAKAEKTHCVSYNTTLQRLPVPVREYNDILRRVHPEVPLQRSAEVLISVIQRGCPLAMDAAECQTFVVLVSVEEPQRSSISAYVRLKQPT